MLTEEQARDIALRAVERLGGVDALERLYREQDEPYPEYDFVIDDQRVIARLRGEDRPASVDVGPYSFAVRDGRLVTITGS